MLKLLFLTFFSLQLFAINPKIYSLLGDMIYNNADEFQKFSNITTKIDEKREIAQYVIQCKKLKEEGFLIESGDKKYSINDYFNRLKIFSRENDHYIKLINLRFSDAIDSNDIRVFIGLVDLTIVNKDERRDKIEMFISSHEDETKNTNYYKTYKENLQKDKTEILQITQNDNVEKKNERFSKIVEIRESDKQYQELLNSKLQMMLLEKKKDI